jgi:hypothetical protein
MGTGTLITGRGPVECWQPRPGFFVAKSHWTADEAETYARTGEYPHRLLALIRREAGVGRGER